MQKDFSEHKKNIGYAPCGDTLSEDLLPQRFAPIETRLMENMRSPEVMPEEFESFCQSELDVFIMGIQPEVVGAVESVENRYDDVRQQLGEEQAQRHRLLSISRLSQLYGNKGRAPLWYWGLYIVLIIAAMAIFATNFGLIIPVKSFFSGKIHFRIPISFLIPQRHKGTKVTRLLF